LSENQLVALSNMWHERTASVLNGMKGGQSYTTANAASAEAGVYDTYSLGEVSSRLGRARGCVVTALKYLMKLPKNALIDNNRIDAIKINAVAIRAFAGRLADLARSLGSEDSLAKKVVDIDSLLVAKSAAKAKTIGQIEGLLKQCRKFLAKNVRDVPLIRAKTRNEPTPNQLAKIRLNLDRISSVAKRILQLYSAQNVGRTVGAA
jgi:ABC-type transporter Mla subunit MlaD